MKAIWTEMQSDETRGLKSTGIQHPTTKPSLTIGFFPLAMVHPRSDGDTVLAWYHAIGLVEI
jgi:hypothetical protein